MPFICLRVQGRDGKVVQVYRKRWVIHIERLTREKVNGAFCAPLSRLTTKGCDHKTPNRTSFDQIFNRYSQLSPPLCPAQLNRRFSVPTWVASPFCNSVGQAYPLHYTSVPCSALHCMGCWQIQKGGSPAQFSLCGSLAGSAHDHSRRFSSSSRVGQQQGCAATQQQQQHSRAPVAHPAVGTGPTPPWHRVARPLTLGRQADSSGSPGP